MSGRSDNRESETSDAEPVTVAIATEEFLADVTARGLKERTIYKYKFLFKQLSAFSEAKGVRYLEQIDLRLLREFRTTWKDRNLAAQKKLERLRAFYGFAFSNAWVEGNLAKKLKKPLIEKRQTLPYSQEEMDRICTAVESLIAKCQRSARDNFRRLKALILLLRYSGLRIGDAVGCDTGRLVGGKLRLYTQKSGTHVHLPLPPFVLKELDSIPKRSERYWFWNGNGRLETAVGDWQGRLLDLAKDAKIQRLHAHRFRDTFAVELLLAGNSLENVSKLLGHSSVKVTEEHYAPWILERQEQAEADVRRAWARDRMVLMQNEADPIETNDTPLIHGKQRLAN